MCRSKSYTVGAGAAGTVSYAGLPDAESAFATLTCIFAKAGRYFETGSPRTMRPSSTSIMAATDTNGLVIE